MKVHLQGLMACSFLALSFLGSSQGFEYGFDSGVVERLLIRQPSQGESAVFGIDLVNRLSFTDTGGYTIQQLNELGELINEAYFQSEHENRRCGAIFEHNEKWLILEDVHDHLENTTRLRVHELDSELNITASMEYDHPVMFSRAVSVAYDRASNGDLLVLSTLSAFDSNPPVFGYGLYRINGQLDTLRCSYVQTPGLVVLFDIMEFGPNDIRITSSGVCHDVQNQFGASSICVAAFDSLWNPTTSYIPEVQGPYQNAGMIADSDSTFLMLWDQYVYTSNWQSTEDYSVYRFDHEYNALDSVYLGQTIGADTANRVEPDCIDIAADGHIYTASTFRFSVPPFWFLESWIEVYKLDADLNVVWRRFYGGDAFYYVNSIRATPDGGAIIFSSRSELVDDMEDAEIDAYILKLGPDGLLTSLPESAGLQSIALTLYPNPSSGQLRVESDLVNYSVILRTMDGREADAWSNCSMTSTLDLSAHARGLYLMTVQSQDIDFEYTEQIILE